MKRLIAFALALAVVFGVSFALYKPERIEAVARETMDDEWVGYFFALEPFDGRRYATETGDDYDFGVPGVPVFVTITAFEPDDPDYEEGSEFNNSVGAAVSDEVVGSGMHIKVDDNGSSYETSGEIALDALGQADRIVAVSGIDYVSNPYIIAHKDSIKDMGPEMNYELLLGLKPDVVLLYGIGDAQTAVTDKLKELSIPYMYVGEYLEESPLGKAEWMVALSELTDSREKGIEIFSEIPKRYQTLKDLTASVEQRPTVMFNTPWNDSWIMPSTKSYMAQLVNDAGADYIYKENTSNSSAPIGLETAYGLIQKADYWINVGMASTLDELKAVNPKFTDAKSVREKTAYNNNLRLTATGGNEYWESAVVRPDIVLRDLIHIFHPELVSDSLYYYRHLE